MYKFFTKASALVFVCFGTSLIFGAEAPREPIHAGTVVVDIRDGIDDVLRPGAATSTIPSDLPIQQCILDFSDTIPILMSTAKLGAYLVSENSQGKLDLLDIAYLTVEGLAAGARKNPGNFGAFATYVIDQNAIFNAFARSIGRIRTAERNLSVLSDRGTCERFVRDTIKADLPVVLDELLKPVSSMTPTDKSAIIGGIVSVISADPARFIPMFASLLNKSYLGLASAAAVVTADIDIEKISGCGCFPCFGKKKS